MLQGKKVLVVGGSSGLGLGIAKSCYQTGAEVHIASRDPKKLQKAQEKVGADCRCIEVDVQSKASVEKMFEGLGTLDHLVVTVGKAQIKTFQETSEAEARDIMDINFWSKFTLVKSATKVLSQQGSVIFVSGAFAQKPNPNLMMASVAIAAVEALAKALALSLSPIRVNAIAPYVIDTSALQDGPIGNSRQAFLDKTRNNLPARYVGSAEDLGHAALFLLSNPYATGSILELHGGYTLL